jgi:hypothetical protein
MMPTVFEQFDHIDQWGKALDPNGNEFRDEQGQVIFVPDQWQHLFTILESV